MSSSDPTSLPPDLPVPVDDGAADHLPGRPLPALRLAATTGGTIDLSEAAGESDNLVLYIYPRTGAAGEPVPPDWDQIPGARGCTPQSCAFRDHFAELERLGARVLGLSSQGVDEQREFAARERIPYPLLSDPELQLAEELNLPTFAWNGGRWYKRLTLIAQGGQIVKVFYPVFPPDRNAGDVVEWLRARGG